MGLAMGAAMRGQLGARVSVSHEYGVRHMMRVEGLLVQPGFLVRLSIERRLRFSSRPHHTSTVLSLPAQRVQVVCGRRQSVPRCRGTQRHRPSGQSVRQGQPNTTRGRSCAQLLGTQQRTTPV